MFYCCVQALATVVQDLGELGLRRASVSIQWNVRRVELTSILKESCRGDSRRDAQCAQAAERHVGEREGVYLAHCHYSRRHRQAVVSTFSSWPQQSGYYTKRRSIPVIPVFSPILPPFRITPPYLLTHNPHGDGQPSKDR